MFRKVLAVLAATSPVVALAAPVTKDASIETSSVGVSYCARQVSTVRKIGDSTPQVNESGFKCTESQMAGRTLAEVSAHRELGVGREIKAYSETEASHDFVNAAK